MQHPVKTLLFPGTGQVYYILTEGQVSLSPCVKNLPSKYAWKQRGAVEALQVRPIYPAVRTCMHLLKGCIRRHYRDPLAETHPPGGESVHPSVGRSAVRMCNLLWRNCVSTRCRGPPGEMCVYLAARGHTSRLQ